MSLKIVFQNEHVIDVDKPAGVLSVDARSKDDPRPILSRMVELEFQTRVFPVHRLDELVSGVLIYAITSDAQRVLNSEFEQHRVKKVYEAFTEQPLQMEFHTNQKFSWKNKILRGKKRAYVSPHGKLAETDAEIENALPGENQLHWILKPKTGRSHQLRFQLFVNGFPILGDQLYNSTKSWREPGIALRSVSLELSERVDVIKLPRLLQVSPFEQFL